MKMLHRFAAIALSCILLLLPGCSAPAASQGEDGIHIVASTYPLYVLACAVTSGTGQVTVGRLNTGQVSCLHDYTLTVSDMRHLEQADVLLLNGAGLEEFMHQALAELSAVQIDCSASISLLESDGHTHHHDSHGDDLDHDHEHDPHYWMSPENLCLMADTIAQALSAADPDNASRYCENARAASHIIEEAAGQWQETLSDLSCPYLITFHDGFHYFADFFSLQLLFSMEEEDGATASAKDILTASTFVKEYHLPAIFTEVNGSGSAARAVSGETGVAVYSLSMVMDGEDIPAGSSVEAAISALLSPMSQNIKTLSEVLK